MKYFYFILMCYFSAFNAAHAAIYSVDLPELNGFYEFPEGEHSNSAITSFDLEKWTPDLRQWLK